MARVQSPSAIVTTIFLSRWQPGSSVTAWTPLHTFAWTYFCMKRFDVDQIWTGFRSQFCSMPFNATLHVCDYLWSSALVTFDTLLTPLGTFTPKSPVPCSRSRQGLRHSESLGTRVCKKHRVSLTGIFRRWFFRRWDFHVFICFRYTAQGQNLLSKKALGVVVLAALLHCCHVLCTFGFLARRLSVDFFAFLT